MISNKEDNPIKDRNPNYNERKHNDNIKLKIKTPWMGDTR